MTVPTTPASRVAPAEHVVVVTSHWRTADRFTQRATADAAMARWEHLPWPEGCLSIACFLSTDGHLVMLYSQWTDEPQYRRHAAAPRRRVADLIIDREPAITHLDTIVARPVGSPASRTADGPFPGCVALVSIATDGPDRQRQAAEAISAFGADTHPGAIGGHLLFSLDGTQVTLYAEWTSEEAHREAIAGIAFGGQRGIFDGTPGIRGLSMHRYQLYRTANR
jgi:heme-degrading monooxygenase HmoA